MVKRLMGPVEGTACEARKMGTRITMPWTFTPGTSAPRQLPREHSLPENYFPGNLGKCYVGVNVGWAGGGGELP